MAVRHQDNLPADMDLWHRPNPPPGGRPTVLPNPLGVPRCGVALRRGVERMPRKPRHWSGESLLSWFSPDGGGGSQEVLDRSAWQTPC